MADDELFENLEDFGDLEEEPSFGVVEDEFPPDLMEPEPQGLSRTFKIVGALMALAVLVIIILLIFFAIGGDKLSPTEKTSTRVVQLNQTIEAEYNATLTALALIEAVSQTAVFHAEQTATAEFYVRQTEQALAATSAAQTATAEFFANQTLAAAQTATQEALNQALTATAEANRLTGIVVDEQGNIFGNVTLKLYRDDGDGIFSPADLLPGTAAVSPVTGLTYNQPVQGTLDMGQTVEWRFNGTAGDVITLDAVAEAQGLDLFAELVGPAGTVLTSSDDDGGNFNPRIADYTLPQTGEYVVRLSSVAGSGAYTLTITAEAGPSARAPRNTGGIVLVQAGGVPTATPEISADELIAVITTATDGTFDFGSLEPGVYWLVLDFASLPPNLQALVPRGEPLVIKITVPVGGEVRFTVGAPPPTATPEPTRAELSPFDMTATAFAELAAQSVTPTETGQAVTPSPTVTALPQTGFFSDLGGRSGAMDGTSGLTLLAIAAAGLVAVVFIARRLRTSA